MENRARRWNWNQWHGARKALAGGKQLTSNKASDFKNKPGEALIYARQAPRMVALMSKPTKRGTPLWGDTHIGLGKDQAGEESAPAEQAPAGELLPVDADESSSGTSPGLGSSPEPARQAEHELRPEGTPTTQAFDLDPLPEEAPAQEEAPAGGDDPTREAALARALAETRPQVPFPSDETTPYVKVGQPEAPGEPSEPMIKLGADIGENLVHLDSADERPAPKAGQGAAEAPPPGGGLEGSFDLAEEEPIATATQEEQKFGPPPEESMPGLDLPGDGGARPIGNLAPVGGSYPVHGGGQGREPAEEPVLDWLGYPSRVIARFLETEGTMVLHLVLCLLVVAVVAATRAVEPIAAALEPGDRSVVITVETVPPGAEVYLDGVLARTDGAAAQVRMRRDAAAGNLRVFAPGHRSGKQKLLPGESRTVKVELEPR